MRYILHLVSNVLVTVCVHLRLLFNPRDFLSILHEEFGRPWSRHEKIVVIYSLANNNNLFRPVILRRTCFLKDGSLIPQIVLKRDDFEKMRTSSKNARGRTIQGAVTGAGDHPIVWKRGKQALKNFLHTNSSTFVDVLKAVPGFVCEHLDDISSRKSNHTALYSDMLHHLYLRTFQKMFGCDLRTLLLAPTDESSAVTDFLDFATNVANSGIEARKGAYDSQYKLLNEIFRKACHQSPEGTFGSDLLHSFEAENEPELTFEMAVANALFYWFAINSVVSSVLHFFCLNMHRHSQHLDQIHDELRHQDFNTSPHLTQCLKETMRLFPPVTAWMPRRSKQNVRLKDKQGKPSSLFIPANSLVMILPTLCIKDMEFVPSRWSHDDDLANAHFGNTTDSSEQDSTFYVPFSTGARTCLMKSFVSDLLETTIRKAISQYDISLVDDDDNIGRHSTYHHNPDVGISFVPVEFLTFQVRARTVV